MKECYLYEKLKDKKVRCQTCSHRCLILPNNVGICAVRKNEDGRLYLLNYGKAVSLGIDPIEKKPFFHFLPGSRSLSFAAAGCNFRCGNCQNWQISQAPRNMKEIWGENWPPKKLVNYTLAEKLPSISYTYTEPTIFLEYALDTMKIAKKKGLKNNWVSNGYQSKEAIELIAPFLDAANVDLKGFTEEFYRNNCGAKLQPVLDSLILMKKKGIWVEVTTLIIPGANDSDEELSDIARFIADKMGKETPWHVSRFSPEISYKMLDGDATPVKTLEKAYKIGFKAGLQYVYVGNVPGAHGENTYCPKCKTLVVDRFGYAIKKYYDKKGRCPKCQYDLNLILK